MKKRILTLTLLMAMLASPVLAAVSFQATLSINEGDGTDYDMIPIWVYSPNTWLAANSFFSANTGLDTRIVTSGGVEYNHMISANLTLAALPIAANSQTNILFTAGNAELSAFDIVLGYGGNLTITDDPSIEPGNRFELTMTDAYIDTTEVGENLWYKEDALRVYVAVSGNITAHILTTGDVALATVSDAGITSGEYDITISANVTHFNLTIDAVLEDSVPL